MPYFCVRVPTGGGKTWLAAKSVALVNTHLLRVPHSLVLWLVPSKTIRDQTLRGLKDAQHPLHLALKETGRVTVLDLHQAKSLTRATLDTSTVVLVATRQAFQVEDEAHNSRAPLAFDTLAGFAPNGIMELTATPDMERTPSNVLHSVSAAQLKAEQMIKLPVVLETEPNWQLLGSGSQATNHCSNLSRLGTPPACTTLPLTTTAGVLITPKAMMARMSSTFSRLMATPLAWAACSMRLTVFFQLAQPVPSTLMSMVFP